jgi:cobalt-zinc-cadmium efflux system outer membrane protein
MTGSMCNTKAVRDTCLVMLLPVLCSGCVLAPSGTQSEQRRLDQYSPSFEQPIDQRQLPPLPAPATWQDVLRHAFLVNGELEAAYFDWKAAMARINQAASWPNSSLAVSYSYMFSGGNIKSWNRNTFGFQPDPAMNLQLPMKSAQAGKVALQDARTAGFRFLGMKFDIQRRVLLAYYDLVLMEEQIRIQQQNVDLLRGVAESTRARVQAGAPQQDLLKAQVEYRLAQNDLQNMEAQRRSAQALLNGLLSRPPEDALTLPPALPAARPVAANDEELIAMGVGQNPELAALAAQVTGRQDALELARLRYIPDINPMLFFTGSVSQTLGAMVMLPTNVPANQGAIAESQAMLRSSQAASRQTGRDRAAGFVAALYFMRNAERQTELFQNTVLPLAEQAMNSSRVSYMAGTVGYSDLIDSQRTLLNTRLMTAQVRMEREKRLAELEALAGTDIETLAAPNRNAAVSPTASPQ